MQTLFQPGGKGGDQEHGNNSAASRLQCCMKDCNGNKYLVLKTDERIKTHELVGLSAKKIEVDGILYNSIGHVIFNLNVTKKIVTNRCKSDKWPTWNVIDHVY